MKKTNLLGELESLRKAQLRVFEGLCSLRPSFVKEADEGGSAEAKEAAIEALEALDELARFVSENLAFTERRIMEHKAEAAKAKASGFNEEDADIVAGIAALAGLIH